MNQFIANSLLVSNAVVDELMVEMSSNALCVYLLITCKSLQKCKISNKISISP